MYQFYDSSFLEIISRALSKFSFGKMNRNKSRTLASANFGTSCQLQCPILARTKIYSFDNQVCVSEADYLTVRRRVRQSTITQKLTQRSNTWHNLTNHVLLYLIWLVKQVWFASNFSHQADLSMSCLFLGVSPARIPVTFMVSMYTIYYHKKVHKYMYAQAILLHLGIK